MIHIGFTGTQKGMTPMQRDKFVELLIQLQRVNNYETTLHHGDCIGADAEAHEVAYCAGTLIHIHPQDKDVSKRAFCDKSRWHTASTVVHPAKPPLSRNEDIVRASAVLLATPYENVEVRRSGTWATIRLAVRNKVPAFIILPNGDLEVRR
jgi:hypothetical protein